MPRKHILITWIACSFSIISLSIHFFNQNSANKKFSKLEVEQIKIISKKHKGEIILGYSESSPVFRMLNEKKEVVWEMQGGNDPKFNLYEKEKVIANLSMKKGRGGDFLLFDHNMTPRIHLSSAGNPGVFLINPSNKTVGAWTFLEKEGSALGLADTEGNAASLFKGGSNPSMAFFLEKTIPLASFGVVDKTPHLLISGPIGNEGIVLHGGSPNSVLIMDEEGRVKILLSKQGIFQSKKIEDKEIRKKDKKVLTLEEQKRLFPSQGERVR